MPRRESRSEINPPRPLASWRVDFSTRQQTLQTSKSSNKPTRGRVYPPPSPSQTDRAGCFFALLDYFGLLCPSKKTYKNQLIFNIFAFWPHQAPTYMHHTCHLMSRGSFVLCFAPFLIAFWTKKHLLPIHKASKPQSLEASRCLGGNREAKSILSKFYRISMENPLRV